MRKRRLFKDFDRLLLTNTVEWASLQFQSILNHVADGGGIPSILTVRIEGYFGHHVIIDGNHRAVAHAYLKKPIRFFEIRSDDDIDRIIQIEARGGFSSFPHRTFLTSATTYKQLVHDAIVAMACEMKTCTVRDRALEFVAESRKRESPEYLEEQHRRLRQEIDRHKMIPVSANTPWQQEYVSNAYSAPVSNTYPRGKAHLIRNQVRSTNSVHTAKPVPDADVNGWYAAMLEGFREYEGSEFPCAYSEIARLCGEESTRGSAIAKKLQEADLLERIRVGEIETGDSYPNGKPVKQRITFWRLKHIEQG